jgi:predicted NAD/FAD-dependent oxidoreductase
MRRRHLLASAAAVPLLGCAPSTPELAGGFAGIAHERGHRLREHSDWPAPARTRKTQVLIAGGGVAGLAAARALRLRGEDFALLELEDAAGGNARGGQVGGIACPLGAHYLPVPGDAAPEVQDLLEELGLRRRVAGRWTYDERNLCHSPQERLYFHGAWQDGLLPLQGVGEATLAQYRRFAALVRAAQGQARYTLPVRRGRAAPAHLALDALTFDAWLRQQGLDDVHLRWYLDYCSRDDFGAGLATVSAWAGIHYFASRHGFHAPGESEGEREAVLTWSQGNGWLTERLAAPLGERLHTGRVVLRIAETRHGVEVDAWDTATQSVERWQAARCVVALPAFVAARVVQNTPDFLRAAAAHTRYAPWLVANLHLRDALLDRPGAAPSWDNVIYSEQPTTSLGYVDAMHQSLRPVPGATVLSCYHALGDLPDGRRQLLEQPWTTWRDRIVAELLGPHPELLQHATRLEITRYGHAMAVPVPGTLARLQRLPLMPGPRAVLHTGRLSYAHSDWSGYSVFEEAFTQGHAAGLAA